jgi:hypothetical protein
MKALKTAAYWLIAGLPLAWGVLKSVQKAAPLFSEKPAAPGVK